MARAYYSIVLDHSADEVWQVIRPFDHYAWAGVEGETIIEDGPRVTMAGDPDRILDLWRQAECASEIVERAQ